MREVVVLARVPEYLEMDIKVVAAEEGGLAGSRSAGKT